MSRRIFYLILTCLLSVSQFGLCDLEHHVFEDKENPSVHLEWVIKVGPEIEKDTEKGICLLLAHTLFYETEAFSRAVISDLLSSTGQDIDPDTHVSAESYPIKIHFRLKNAGDLEKGLALLNEMARHAKISSQSVELARRHLGTEYHLEHLTANQLQAFYKKWFRPDLMHITVVGGVDQKETEKLLCKQFSLWEKPQEASPLPKSYEVAHKWVDENVKNVPEELLSCKALVPTEKGKEYLIDGKIYMRNPSWYQKRWYGRWFGAGCIALGVGVVVVGCVTANPLIAIAGIAPFVTGGWFLVDPYLMDPVVIHEKRQEDLHYGLHYSYSHHRAGLTLTPFERREGFINECRQYLNGYPEKLYQFPIAHLADTYDLRDSVLREALYQIEINDLYDIEQEFIMRRNEMKRAKNMLEEELNQLLLPHQIIRDLAIDNAYAHYENNPYVIELRELESQRNREIDAVWCYYDCGEIDEEICEDMILTIEVQYDDLMSDYIFQSGLENARKELELARDKAYLIYEAKVQEMKLLINYDERLYRIDEGIWAIYYYHNSVLCEHVSSFNLDPHAFCDYVDLR